jgi:hypothetical protein
MAFLKTILSKTVPVEPLNEVIKKKINQLVLSQLDDYEKNYNRELYSVYKEWKSAGKKFTFPELDQETHNRAGVKSLKTTITNKTWIEIGDDIDKEVKTKTTNEMVIKASNSAGKKSVGVIVSKSIDEGLKKITKKAEARKK